jgi:hypothetical protein
MTKTQTAILVVVLVALRDTGGLARLEYLSDRIGHRLSGSASLERAIEWSAAETKKAGLGERPDSARQGAQMGARK